MGEPDLFDAAKAEVARSHAQSKLLRVVTQPLTPQHIERRLRSEGGVVGQDDVVRSLCVGFMLHVERIRDGCSDRPREVRMPRVPTLLIGPSGSGKTFIVQQLARHGLRAGRLPFLRTDLNRLTQAGYYGGDADDIVMGLIRAAGNDRDMAELGGVCLGDELCKCRFAPGLPRDIGGQMAQAALLDLIAGEVVAVDSYAQAAAGTRKVTIQFAMSGVWVLAAGAFEGLVDIVRRRVVGRRGMGFGAEYGQARDRGLERADLLRQVTTDDLIAYGIIPELSGRFASILVLDPLSRDDMRAILDLPHGPIARWRQAACAMGFDLRLCESLLDAMAEEAVRTELGARSLEPLVSRVVARAFYELPGNCRPTAAGVRVCHLGLDALTDGSYELSWSRRASTVRRIERVDESAADDGDAAMDDRVAGG
jgi:ATP-dependent Clp protease ATP-binding subunit ClpX